MASNTVVSLAPPAVGPASVDVATLWKKKKKVRSRIQNTVSSLRSRGFRAQPSKK